MNDAELNTYYDDDIERFIYYIRPYDPLIKTETTIFEANTEYGVWLRSEDSISVPGIYGPFELYTVSNMY